ncbi:MAG: hypothetical protein V4850_24675 [Myxococcota bacterium]
MEARTRYSSPDIRAFEAEQGVVLPSGYARYLTEVGVGPRQPVGGPAWGWRPVRRELPISLLEDWYQPYSEPDEGMLSRAFDPDQREGRLRAGALRAVNLGCETYGLLVVTGPCRGTLWYDALHLNSAVPLVTGLGTHLTFDDIAGPLGGAWLHEAVLRVL